MADPDNIVLEYLRHIRAGVDRIEMRLDDLTVRMGHVERAVAEHSAQLAEVNIKLDRMDSRIARIEKRLDLADA
jgi:uncharacterized coiled-coil protein SlyX